MDRNQDDAPIILRSLKQTAITLKATSVKPARTREAIWPHIDKLRVIKTEALPENITPTLRTP
jgi:hypothetical protein